MNAQEYNAREIREGRLTAAHLEIVLRVSRTNLVAAVETYQRLSGLTGDDVDGRAGKMTRAIIDRALCPDRCWPFRMLADGRMCEITCHYGPREDGFHKGADIMVPWAEGDAWHYKHFFWAPGPAIACAAGRVIIHGRKRTGWRLWIDHGDGDRTGYFHLADPIVEPGDLVAMGQELGPLAPRSVVWPPHVHLELSEVGLYRPRDPAPWLATAIHLPAI